jgi:hypothetical protein
MSYLSWRYLHTELATENYQARVFGISAGIVRIGLEQVTRKETTVTRRMNFVVFVLKCITMKDASGQIQNCLRLAHTEELEITKKPSLFYYCSRLLVLSEPAEL